MGGTVLRSGRDSLDKLEGHVSEVGETVLRSGRGSLKKWEGQS